MSCALTAIGGGAVGLFAGSITYVALAGLVWGPSDAPGAGIAVGVGMIASGAAGFIAGVARYLQLLIRAGHAASATLRALVAFLFVLSLLVFAAPTLLFVPFRLTRTLWAAVVPQQRSFRVSADLPSAAAFELSLWFGERPVSSSRSKT